MKSLNEFHEGNLDNHLNENENPVAGFLTQMEAIKKDKNAFKNAVKEFSKASKEQKEEIQEFVDEALPEQKDSVQEMIEEFKSGNLTPDMLNMPMNTKQAIKNFTELIDLIDFSIDFVKKYVK